VVIKGSRKQHKVPMMHLQSHIILLCSESKQPSNWRSHKNFYLHYYFLP